MYKEKIEKLIAQLSCGSYERDECLKLLLLSMFAGKSIFLFGPPGTAKSMIARRASEAFNVDDSENKFFDYLMNRFSTPEEIFGPIDIAELKKNNLKRQTQGYLPNAHFAFLDEIWKSSPAILNTLLTIINERIYKSGKDRIKELFDYEIPIVQVEKAGITTTGAKCENELLDVVKEFEQSIKDNEDKTE